MENCPKSYL